MYTSARLLPLSAQALKEHADACRSRGEGGGWAGEGSAGKGVAVERGGGGRVWGERGEGGRVWGNAAAQGLGLGGERVERGGVVEEGASNAVGLEGGRAVAMEGGRDEIMEWGGADLVLGLDWVSRYEKMSIRFRPHHPGTGTSTLTDALPPCHPLAPRQITVPQVYVYTGIHTYIRMYTDIQTYIVYTYMHARTRARANPLSLSHTHTHAPGAVYDDATRLCLGLVTSVLTKLTKLTKPCRCCLYDDATRLCVLGQTQTCLRTCRLRHAG